MKVYIYYENSGRISFTANTLIENSFNVLEVEDSDIDGEILLHYIKNGILKKMPLAESKYMRFNYDSEIWEIPLDTSALLSEIRAQRDSLLAASDWTQLPDVPLATKQLWASYRQELRDITNQTDFSNIVWPIPPQ